MSQTTTPAAEVHEPAHPPHLAHHFDTPAQQFESGKLGLWLFLTTEVLLFSGLFCWYAVYRHNHPEIFLYAHLYLDKLLGAANTVILLFSSFTIAWSVRAAQLGQRKLLIGLLTTTLLCGFAFLGIKAVEYYAKIQHHTLWGAEYAPHSPPHGADVFAGGRDQPAASQPASAAAPQTKPTHSADGFLLQQSDIKPAARGPAGINPEWVHKTPEEHEWHGPEPANVNVFFGIYFVMTGLHGLHVVAGMICISWILYRSIRGDFGPQYFNPVDFTALYWHLVDLVWILLFPLLYLIK